MAAEGDTAVSIRPHHIKLSTLALSDDTNWAAGTVTRQTYLGAERAYQVALASGDIVQVIAEPEPAYAKGQALWLHMPREHCRALAR